MKYLGDQQIGKFIKKTLKIYKALRVLEKSKSNETPYFSRSIEKLIRFFTKKLPDNWGIEGTLTDLARSMSDVVSNIGGLTDIPDDVSLFSVANVTGTTETTKAKHSGSEQS